MKTIDFKTLLNEYEFPVVLRGDIMKQDAEPLHDLCGTKTNVIQGADLVVIVYESQKEVKFIKDRFQGRSGMYKLSNFRNE